MAKVLRGSAAVQAAILAASTDATKITALKTTMGTGTQTVSVKDSSAVEKLAGTFSGALYSDTGATFLPPATLSSTTGAGGTVGADWTCRITSSATAWIEGEFGAGEVFTASAAVSTAGAMTISLDLTESVEVAPATPPTTVTTWIVRTTDPVVAVPANVLAMHAHRYPDNGDYIPTPSAAFTYDFGTIRTMDYEYAKWSDTNTADGVYDWTALDALIDFHSAAGRDVMYTLLSTPAWAAATTYTNPWGVVGGAGHPTSLTSVSTFVTALITRYNTDSVRDNGGLKKITYFECWNEPDYFPYTANNYWKDTATWLAQMSKTAYDAAKAVDASIIVVSPGIVDTAGTRSFENFDMAPQAEPNKCSKLAEATAGGGSYGRDVVDELAWHWYDYQAPATAATNALKFNTLCQSMRTVHTEAGYSATAPIHNTEIGGWGWSSTSPPQAAKVLWLWRTFLIGCANGLKTICYYAHEDMQYIGAPATDSVIAAALDGMHTSVPGKSIRQAAILNDNTVWVETTDGTQYRK